VRVLSTLILRLLVLSLVCLSSCRTHPKLFLSDFSSSYSKKEIDRGTRLTLYHNSESTSRLKLLSDPYFLPQGASYELHARMFYQSGQKDTLHLEGKLEAAGRLEFDLPLLDKSVGHLELRVRSLFDEFDPFEVESLFDKRTTSRQNFSVVDAQLDEEMFGGFLVEERDINLFYRGDKVRYELLRLDDSAQRLPPPPYSKSRQLFHSELPTEPIANFSDKHESYVLKAVVDSLEIEFYLSLQDDYFPAVDSPNDLLGPLRYICTKSEFEELRDKASESDLKTAIDDFWMERSGSFERGRVLVSEFYGRVERANRLFSQAWAGWKTDRGMLYIIYGQADRVLKNERLEEWIYLGFNGKSDIRFLFVRKKDGSFELKRDTDYRKSWNENVYLWRSGIINNVSH